MKKLIVMAAVALFGTQVAKAQISKGDILLGGNVNVTAHSDKAKDADKKNTTTSFGISPKVGYALNNNWVVGVFAGTNFGFAKDINDNKAKTFSINPGIFVRNYQMLGQSKFAFFAEGNASYGFGSTKLNDVKQGSFNSFNVNVQPGIAYFVTKRFMIEGMFGGASYNWKQDKNELSGAKHNYSDFNFNFTNEFALGVNFKF
ncbi:MAG: outer membrane beta-barrel protein [Chitinophaga sp.]|uniref:outer membrane beta-barrel protein n=1 Tax=Chitinophaga sp. TaxID=1869181 RepID=UPI0025BADA32|nr:outer membrane beta-barrel protein [Chitinophaga sp.]MBV8254436.1 outer membrane beta-barrel protein [Chitinophaga sp.]